MTATTGSAALALVPGPASGGAPVGVLSGVVLAGEAARLAAALDPGFLAEAGWDPQTRVLSLPAAHPLMGRQVCRTPGCPATAHGSGSNGLCWQCSSRLARDGWTPEEIEGARELPPLPRRADGCLVPGCQRMSPGGRQGQRSGLCQAHSRRIRRVPGTRIEDFLADPRVRPLPPLGPCRVAACSRRRESEHGYCPTHYVRWRTAVTADPATDQARWDLAVFGHPGRLSFTAITQPWLREAAKAWAADDLPRHRGGGARNVREKITAVARLSESLRSRSDRGGDPGALGRADIDAFLGRLGYLESAGTISRYRRNVVCRGARFVLTGIRSLGLTRPGQPAAGLHGDFAIGVSDIPADPVRGEPGRDLPPEIISQLCAGLDTLEPAEVRTAIEVAIDTGRRPEDILGLPLDCLDRDRDGAPVLVYDNIKADRLGRRLPADEATAAVITAQQERTRARYPEQPPAALRLLPAPRSRR